MSEVKILVVEDECVEALDIEAGLTSLGYTVLDIVTSGKEALKQIEALHPDLVLMDIMLQGEIDGVTVAEQIRARFNIPVIYLTASTDVRTLHRARASAPAGLLFKPFKEKDLHKAVDQALAHRKGKEVRKLK